MRGSLLAGLILFFLAGLVWITPTQTFAVLPPVGYEPCKQKFLGWSPSPYVSPYEDSPEVITWDTLGKPGISEQVPIVWWPVGGAKTADATQINAIKRFVNEGGIFIIDLSPGFTYQAGSSGLGVVRSGCVNFLPDLWGLRQVRAEPTEDWVVHEINPEYEYLFENILPGNMVNQNIEELFPSTSKSTIMIIGEPQGVLKTVVSDSMCIFYPEGARGAIIIDNWAFSWHYAWGEICHGYPNPGTERWYADREHEEQDQFKMNLCAYREYLLSPRQPSPPQPTTPTSPPSEGESESTAPSVSTPPASPYELYRYLFMVCFAVGGTLTMVLGRRLEE